MREELYFVIMGWPEDMQAAYPNQEEFYRGVDENGHEVYALTFSMNKSKASSLLPMVQGLMCIPGAVTEYAEWQIQSDELARYKGLTVKRLATREALDAFGHSCEIVQL